MYVMNVSKPICIAKFCFSVCNANVMCFWENKTFFVKLQYTKVGTLETLASWF